MELKQKTASRTINTFLIISFSSPLRSQTIT
jgi:hypothetical protein